MNLCETTLRRIVCLLVLSGLCIAGNRNAAAQHPQSLRDRVWNWGYVMPGELPGKMPFIYPATSSCSLETAAAYLGTPNVVLMNNNWTASDLELLKGSKRVLCAITSRDIAGAKKVSELSKKYPNIVGALIDDFYPGKEKLPVEVLKDVYAALKSANPELKLYVVRYTFCKDDVLVPYLPYFDVINLWVWVANKKEWTTLDKRIEKLQEVTHKPVLMGLFLHNYGEELPPGETENEPYSDTKPVSMDILEAQFVKSTKLLRKGKIEGFVILQNGWFDKESHRPQIQWIKQYLDWLFGTQTVRNE